MVHTLVNMMRRIFELMSLLGKWSPRKTMSRLAAMPVTGMSIKRTKPKRTVCAMIVDLATCSKPASPSSPSSSSAVVRKVLWVGPAKDVSAHCYRPAPVRSYVALASKGEDSWAAQRAERAY